MNVEAIESYLWDNLEQQNAGESNGDFERWAENNFSSLVLQQIQGLCEPMKLEIYQNMQATVCKILLIMQDLEGVFDLQAKFHWLFQEVVVDYEHYLDPKSEVSFDEELLNCWIEKEITDAMTEQEVKKNKRFIKSKWKRFAKLKEILFAIERTTLKGRCLSFAKRQEWLKRKMDSCWGGCLEEGEYEPEDFFGL